MLKHNKQHTKLNNKGLTLVEVIVSVTLLVLVSGFILSSLVSAMRSAAKARDLHRASTVAQNIMEGVNLKTAEDLAYQFNYPKIDNGMGGFNDNFAVYPSSKFEYDVSKSVGELYQITDGAGNFVLKKVNAHRSLIQYNALLADPTTDPEVIMATASATLDGVTGLEYEFLPDTNKNYIYYMRHIENDGRYFDAKLVFSAANYTATGSSGITANDDMLISIPSIDSTYDAVEVMGGNFDDKAMNQLAVLEGESVEKEELHRIIEVVINDAVVSGGFHRTRVDVKYYYSFDKEDGSISPSVLIEENTPFYNEGSEETKSLRNIYLYYYPLYKEGSNTDTIVVKNTDNIDVEMYIIKQESNFLTDDEIKLKEESYEVTFNVEETTDSADGNSHITLHTNWDENLYAVKSPVVLPTLYQVKLRRNGILTTDATYRRTDIRNKKASDRMYDVRLEIYMSEKYDSETDFINVSANDYFKAENHLFTFESSICQ